MTRIRVGTRRSALALWQARQVAAWLQQAAPGVEVTLVEIVSTGDELTDVPLTEVEGTGFFTAALDRALLAGEVDVAVHSFKDVPVEMAPGLAVAAVPVRGPVDDVLCARDGLTLAGLRPGARVGTCSARRTAQVRAIRADLDIRPFRGNVPTRVARVAAGDLDAVVLARAGLMRLGLEAHITDLLPLARVLPAPAQGALAVVCRAGATALHATLSGFDDTATRDAVTAERTVLHALGGGCSVPVGALARREGDVLHLTAGVFAQDGQRRVRLEVSGANPVVLGEMAARQLVAAGADALLEEFRKEARLDLPAPQGATS
jgi:hydroxymethylbilane synthase